MRRSSRPVAGSWLKSRLGRCPGSHGALGRWSERATIRAHLASTELRLRKATSPDDHVRVGVLDRLHEYWRAAAFPENTYQAGSSPVFVDDRGVRCAVADLMFATGAGELADRIQRVDNLVDLTDGPPTAVSGWCDDHHLTPAEAALIQPTYCFGDPPPPSCYPSGWDLPVPHLAVGLVSVAVLLPILMALLLSRTPVTYKLRRSAGLVGVYAAALACWYTAVRHVDGTGLAALLDEGELYHRDVPIAEGVSSGMVAGGLVAAQLAVLYVVWKRRGGVMSPVGDGFKGPVYVLAAFLTGPALYVLIFGSWNTPLIILAGLCLLLLVRVPAVATFRFSWRPDFRPGLRRRVTLYVVLAVSWVVVGEFLTHFNHKPAVVLGEFLTHFNHKPGVTDSVTVQVGLLSMFLVAFVGAARLLLGDYRGDPHAYPEKLNRDRSELRQQNREPT